MFIQIPKNNIEVKQIEYHLFRIERKIIDDKIYEDRILVEKSFCRDALSRTIMANRQNNYAVEEVTFVPLEYKLKELEERIKKLEKNYDLSEV